MKISLLLVLLVSFLAACTTTSPTRQKEVVENNESKRICNKPADDVLETSKSAGVQISTSRNSADGKIQVEQSTKYDRVRQEDTAVQRLEIINYNLCLDYTQGRISKQTYDELYKKNFEEAFSAKKQ